MSLPVRFSILFLFLLICQCDSAINERDDVIPAGVSHYLSSFGYLPPNDPLTGNLRSESSVRQAIRQLQRFAGLEATGIVDANTKKLMKKKRCGIPDYQYQEYLAPNQNQSSGFSTHHRRRYKRYILQGARWPYTNLTYRIVSFAHELGRSSTRRVVYDALQLWAGESGLSFQETDQDDADINVEFASGLHGDGYPFDGANVVLAHAFFPGPSLGGDAHFDDAEAWIADIQHDEFIQEVSLYSVAAHEFGHSIGLSHSNVTNSLMYPYYKMYKRGDTLPYDDIMGIQALYGVGAKGVPVKPDPSTTTTTTTPTPPTPPPTRATPAPPPNECASTINAISRIRGQTFVFKDEYFWRLDYAGNLLERPLKLRHFWRGLAANITCDAIFEMKEQDRVLLFSGNQQPGKQYWIFNANAMLPGYPQPLTSLGLPESVDRIDAAFVWDWNSSPYLFSNGLFWRIDHNTMKVESKGYPRVITNTWKGVPAHVNAAYTDSLGELYIFSGINVYKFHSRFMKVDRDYPVLLKTFWKHCQVQQPMHMSLIQKSGVTNRMASKLLVTMFFMYYIICS